MNPKKPTVTHTVIKWTKQRRVENVKSSSRKTTCYTQGNPRETTSRSSVAKKVSHDKAGGGGEAASGAGTGPQPGAAAVDESATGSLKVQHGNTMWSCDPTGTHRQRE